MRPIRSTARRLSSIQVRNSCLSQTTPVLPRHRLPTGHVSPHTQPLFPYRLWLSSSILLINQIQRIRILVLQRLVSFPAHHLMPVGQQSQAAPVPVYTASPTQVELVRQDGCPVRIHEYAGRRHTRHIPVPVQGGVHVVGELPGIRYIHYAAARFGTLVR